MRKEQLAFSRRQMVSDNLAEFGNTAGVLNWVSPSGAAAAEGERTRRLEAIGQHLNMAFKGTKPHIGSLSPGCRICGEGGWSCLFINGKCNCRCFYCPSPQDEIGVPTTHRVAFARPTDYAAYLAHFGFRGTSISGGEPLLTPELTLRFLQAVNRSDNRPKHLWMYTNGSLLTADLVKRLRDAGLDEIRFDLSAVDYDLRKVRLAVGTIPVVTVEIPAIPEDVGRLTILLPRLKGAGVDYLNLHQLRLTPFNRDQLARRHYTYLHGEKVTVLESELTALALMQNVVERGIGIPVNYCAFVYQHRFQQAAARRNSARLMVKPHESVTEKGYIRSLFLSGDPENLSRQAGRLSENGVDDQSWTIDSRHSRLFFHPKLWDRVNPTGLNLAVGYAEAFVCPQISYHRTFKEIRVSQKKTLFIEKQPVSSEILLNDAQQLRFNALAFSPDNPAIEAGSGVGDSFEDFERIFPGLQDYF